MLSDHAARLLAHIVARISSGAIRADEPRTFLTYKSVHDDLNLELHGPTYGLSLLNHGLTELVTMLRDSGHPAISSLIVKQDGHVPGDDFFRFHGRGTDDYQWWLQQAQLSLAYDWQQTLRTQTRLAILPCTYPDEVDPSQHLIEGAVRQVLVNEYERSDEGRRVCLQHYGYHCTVCGFNFEARYGDIGRNFIHVHHLIPMASLIGQYRLDPIADLRPVCPNCHAMLHARKPPFTVDELRRLLRQP